MSCERTSYDKMMQKKYNPMREGYHAHAFVTPRTEFDQKMQKQWCPNCDYSESSRCAKGQQYAEGYAPLHGFRTQYDEDLQKRWCAKCPSDQVSKECYASTMHDWNNKWTYSHVPYYG